MTKYINKFGIFSHLFVPLNYSSKVGCTSEMKEKGLFSLHFARFSLPLQAEFLYII